jgi:hypothetical protein
VVKGWRAERSRAPAEQGELSIRLAFGDADAGVKTAAGAAPVLVREGCGSTTAQLRSRLSLTAVGRLLRCAIDAAGNRSNGGQPREQSSRTVLAATDPYSTVTPD